MERKKLILIIALVAVVLIGAIGGTIAYFSNSRDLKNTFIADTLDMEAIEDFTSPDNWLPGETTEKKVRAKNTTKLQMAVRISYTEHWEDRERNILPDSFDGEKAAVINFVNEDDWVPETKNDVTYFYYYKLLNPEETTSDFMESVTFNKNAIGDVVCTPREDGRGEECKMSTDYEDATYYLNIKIEMIAFDKYKENWDTDVDISEEGRIPLIDKIKGDAIIDNIRSKYVSDEQGINFSQNASNTNGEGIYLRAGTENDDYPIYYFRGNVDNNNVLFANLCWQILRTTEKGGVKLIYNGLLDEDGTCVRSASENGIDRQILSSNIYNRVDSPAYVGYMRGVNATTSDIDYEYKRFTTSANVIYGNDVEYNNGMYTLISTQVGSDSSHHYTCLNNGITCNKVAYVYYVSGNDEYYLLLSDGENIEAAKEKMFDNKYDSNLKIVIDNWFVSNLNNYVNYLEDSIWCNNRTIIEGGLESKDSEMGSSMYASWYRDNISKYPAVSLEEACPNKNDRFTVNDIKNGNGKLSFPVGLITVEEVLLGGLQGKDNYSNYLYTGQDYWLMSPFYFTNYYSANYQIISNNLNSKRVKEESGVRPSISLKNEIVFSGGDGMANNPYVIYTKS